MSEVDHPAKRDGMLELFAFTRNQLSSLYDRIFDDDPNPLRPNMLGWSGRIFHGDPDPLRLKMLQNAFPFGESAFVPSRRVSHPEAESASLRFTGRIPRQSDVPRPNDP